MLSTLALANTQELLVFIVAVFVLNATPGVDLLLTITRTLQGGARAGVAAAPGGGWRLRLLEDGEEIGGGVFPAENNQIMRDAAYEDALAEASARLATRVECN